MASPDTERFHMNVYFLFFVKNLPHGKFFYVFAKLFGVSLPVSSAFPCQSARTTPGRPSHDPRTTLGRPSDDPRTTLGRPSDDPRTTLGRPSNKTKCVSNDRSGHDDSNGPRIVKIGAILAIFQPFEVFGHWPSQSFPKPE